MAPACRPRIFVDLAKQHPNFRFAKLEVLLPGTKSAEIIEQSKGQVQMIYGLGGIAMIDGLAHGASAVMPGSWLASDVYVRVYELYKQGQKEEAKALFYQLVPYLSFAMQRSAEVPRSTSRKRVLVRHAAIHQ